MRVGELSTGLDIEDVDIPTRKKKGSVKIRNSQSRDQTNAWRDFKQTSKSALFKKVAVLNWGKDVDFTVQPLPMVNFSLKKDIRLYVKRFRMNSVHKMFGFVNSQKFMIKN